MGEGLSIAAKAVIGKELILVCGTAGDAGTLYTHEEFLGAFQEALLDRISASVPVGASSRTAMRALAALRTPEAHKATLAGALVRLRKSGQPVLPSALRDSDRHVVATFAMNA